MTLTAGEQGPILLQDFQLLDRLAHFDRERVPERVAHAKGAGAFGYFEVTADVTKWCKAKFLDTLGKRTPTFVRFSTTSRELVIIITIIIIRAQQIQRGIPEDSLSSSTLKKETTIWWATTLQHSSSETQSSSLISSTHKNAIPKLTCHATTCIGTSSPKSLNPVTKLSSSSQTDVLLTVTDISQLILVTHSVGSMLKVKSSGYTLTLIYPSII